MRRTLHAAAMPFPTPQGTQGAVRAMMRALATEGREATLLTYAHGEGPVDPELLHLRLPDWPRERRVRSGPSVRKVALDLSLAAHLRAAMRRARAEALVAHNAEAAAAALLARARPLVYFAHTTFGVELPYYAPPALGAPLGAAGRALDLWLSRRADAVCAVSPALATLLEARTGVTVRAVPLPWPVPPPLEEDERARARQELGLASEATVLLYAGNLDAYQGWEDVVGAAARVPSATLLVATASAPASLEAVAREAGLGARLRVTGLADEAARRRVHAAADLALVPRRAEGGLPVKLLDALARDVPVVTTRRATAGLPVAPFVTVVADDDPRALADGARDALARSGDPGAGRAYVARAHSDAAFVAALDAVVEDAIARAGVRAG